MIVISIRSDKTTFSIKQMHFFDFIIRGDSNVSRTRIRIDVDAWLIN